MSVVDDTIGPRPYEASRDDPQTQARFRRSLGPGYDWLMELGRQLYRPALGVIVLGGLARHWIYGAELSEGSLLILAGLAAALAGIRAAEITMNRPGR